MADNSANLSTLLDAIDKVSKATLISMLGEICSKYPSARAFVRDQLFVNENEVPQPGSPATSSTASDDSDDDNERENTSTSTTTATTSHPKRLRERYARCSNCLKEFDVAENSRKSCAYHPGMQCSNLAFTGTYPHLSRFEVTDILNIQVSTNVILRVV